MVVLSYWIFLLSDTKESCCRLLSPIMAGVSMTSEYECPVCHEDYTEPKILPCAHLACRECIISWLGKGGGQGGCPLCRAPIMPPTRPGQGDLATLVDALPTDLATVALVESHKILNGPHVCTMCQTSVLATSYCLQCDIKLCQTCTSYHQKLPATKEHTLEDLSTLTALRLATNRRSTCKSHTDKPTELYCSSHQDLLCILCAATNHRSCPEVKAITDVAKEMRAELKQRAQRLRQKDIELAVQIKACKEKFKAMRMKVKGVCDDLQQRVEKQRKQANDLIQAKEDTAMTSLTALDNFRATVTSHAGSIDHIVTSSPDAGLLLMLKQLTSRLNDLESQSVTAEVVKAVGDISFDDQILTRLKSDLFTFGIPGNEVRLMLIGKSRAGKSASGNTILGQEMFRVMSFGYETETCDLKCTLRNGLHVKVVDTPGVFSISPSKEDVDREIAKAAAAVTPGPHAVLMMVGCNNRFTTEDSQAYEKLKELFGEELNDLMIVVFTGIDSVPLADVVKKAPPKLQQIIADAQGRYIGFDNTLPWGERQKQGDALLRLVGRMMTQNGGQYYSTDLVKRVKEIMQKK